VNQKKTAPQKPVPPPTIPERLQALEQGIVQLDRVTIPRLVVGVNDELSKLDRVLGALRRDLAGIMEVVDTCVGLLGDENVANELQNRRVRRAMDADTRLQEMIIADLEAGKLEAETTVRPAEGQEPGSLIVTQEFAEGSEDPLPGSYSARFMRDSLPEIVRAFTDKGPGAEAIIPLKKNGQPVLDEKGAPRSNKIVLIGVYKQKPLPPPEAAPAPAAPEPTAPAAPEAAEVPAEPQEETVAETAPAEAAAE
jgi:hypothetical protein